MKIRYLTLLSTLVILGFTVFAFAKGKPGGETTYTASLTGSFDFFLGGLTTARKGKSLSGNETLSVVRDPDSEDIFKVNCPDLLTSEVTDFTVLDKNWGISYTRSRGGLDQIHITMNNLETADWGISAEYDPVDFDLHLHGEIASDDDFLPKSGFPVTHDLTRYKLWAGGQGDSGSGWLICNSGGDGMGSWWELKTPTTLTITAITTPKQ